LLLLILAGVGAYFTAPTREAHEEAARAFLDARGEAAQQSQGLSLKTMINYVQGMMAGRAVTKITTCCRSTASTFRARTISNATAPSPWCDAPSPGAMLRPKVEARRGSGYIGAMQRLTVTATTTY
jgi:hypothetical protein